MGLCPTWWPPSEYMWRLLLKNYEERKFRNSVPCIPRRKVLLTPTAQVLCSNAANIGKRKTWTQSEFCTWQNSVRGQQPPKCTYSAPALKAAKRRTIFGSPLLNDVGVVTKPRRETRWNLLGCPELANRSQPLVGRSSPRCEDMWMMWRRYFHLTLSCDCRYVP